MDAPADPATADLHWALDHTLALWNFGAAALSAIATLLTLLVAYFVYREARDIRRTEWASKASQNWQEFNNLILQSDSAGRWACIIKGQCEWGDITQRDLHLIYGFFNILVFEYSAKTGGLLSSRYADHSIGQNILYFRKLWPDLRKHLHDDGWPKDFLIAADRYIADTLGNGPARKWYET